MKKNRLFSLILFIVMLTAIGCVSASYELPTHKGSKEKYETIIYAPYDKVWSQLIQYAGQTFFAIDNYEKASGLITLSFGTSNPEKFITGGHWKYKDSRAAKQIDFSGDYVRFASMYNRGELSGRMNIVVSEMNKGKTKIRVNARYNFSTMSKSGRQRTWSFDTGSCDTVKLSNLESAPGTENYRKICPTYKAENTIIETIENNIQEH